MIDVNDYLTPDWPPALQRVDIARVRFALDFMSPCRLRPADFLGLGRVLRGAARQWLDPLDAVATSQWGSLFQPTPSEDPLARRLFQKPAPGFVVTMPIMQEKFFDIGDQLDLEVLFLGTGIPLINYFLRSLVHLGRLGLVAGEGCFEVTAAYSRQTDLAETLAWRQNEPLANLTCAVQPLPWLLQKQHVSNIVTLKFLTPTRLMVDGKPLRQPRFTQIFPFMLRRVTSMLYAHNGIEVLDDPTPILAQARQLDELVVQLHWQDWRSIAGRHGLVIGGFVGEMQLSGEVLGELYWVLAVAALLGLGKGASYGAGQFAVSS